MDMENVKQIFRDAGTAISRAVQVNNNDNNNVIDLSDLVHIIIYICLCFDILTCSDKYLMVALYVLQSTAATSSLNNLTCH